MWTSMRKILVLVLVAPALGYANHWPMFDRPDERFLLNNGQIDTQSCPVGQGKLVEDSRINIHQMLCGSYCPEEWNWEIRDDGRCKDLATEFEFLGYEIERVNNDDGTTNYSVVDAVYGNSVTLQREFIYRMRTEAGRGRYCLEEKDGGGIVCANDSLV